VEIDDETYLASVLNSLHTAGTLSENTLPRSVQTRFATTALGDSARAKNFDATAVGAAAFAGGRDSTAVGQYAGAFGTRGAAVGANVRSYGERAVVVGGFSHAHGRRATVVGTDGLGYGDRTTVAGSLAVAVGARSSAFGHNARVARLAAGQTLEDVIPETGGYGGLVECAHEPDYTGDREGFVADCDQYFTAGERADARLSADTEAGATFRAGIRTRLAARLDALGVERATAIGDSAQATRDYATAVGYNARAGADRSVAFGANAAATATYSIAIGAQAQSTANNGIALGYNARVTGAGGIAIGAGVQAAANQVVIGGGAHTYTLPGLAATQTTDTEVVTVDENGQLAADGGALHRRVDALETTVGAAGDTASDTGSVFARVKAAQADADTAQAEVDTLETTVGAAADAASDTGSVFARVKAAQADADTAQTAADAAQGEVDTLETTVGAATDAASDTGSVFARVKAAQADADTAQTAADAAQADVDALETTVGTDADTASATGTLFARVKAAQGAGAGGGTTQADPALAGRVGTLETAVGAAADTASATGTVFARVKNAQAEVDALETTVGAAADAASETGSVFARVKNAQADADAAQAAAGSAGDTASTTGSAHARITELRVAWQAAASDSTSAAAAAVTTANQAIEAAGEASNTRAQTIAEQAASQAENPDSAVNPNEQRFESVTIRVGSADERVVLKLKGGATEQIATLVALLRQPAKLNQRVVDGDGNPIGTTGTEFAEMDANNPDPTAGPYDLRTGYLFEALYGNPRDGNVNVATTDSYRPNENSIFGRHQHGILRSAQDVEMMNGRGPLGQGLTQQQRRDLEATTAGYRDAPNIGSGGDAPATANNRRVVVQDVNQDGTIQLRTVESTQLTGTDQRVDALSTRVEQTAASSAALSALPNTVPGNRRFFLGLGMGNYRSESALAVGMSARMQLQSGKADFFANAGAASTFSKDSDTSSRIGIGWAW